MKDATRQRIADLSEVLARLDALLASGTPPAVPLARLLLAVDHAANELAGLAELLAPGRADR
jgi:hypothetical protein